MTLVENNTIFTLYKLGKYKINPDTGEVTFEPNKDFTGTPVPVEVQVTDKNGTPAKATFVPTITPVTPTGEDVAKSGKQGDSVSATPTFKNGDEGKTALTPSATNPAKLIKDGSPMNDTEIEAKDVNGKVVGKYKINPETGEVTFEPNKEFTGTPVPATVQVTDKNGTPATAKFTPVIIPVVPETITETTSAIQEKNKQQHLTSVTKQLLVRITQ